MELYSYQVSAVERMKNGCILCGDVGTGKSRTALAYFYTKVINGSLEINGKGTWGFPTDPRDLYIITTAKKRDDDEWIAECIPFALGKTREKSVSGILVTVDSWNNIKKYSKVSGAFFIFDEQRVTGSGPWVKAFYQITRRNQWILLSATPGDKWTDYIPVFIANGFYSSKTEFQYKHCVYSPYVTSYPKLIGYRDEPLLLKHRSDILVRMFAVKKNVRKRKIIHCNYEILKYNKIKKEYWNIFEDKPIDTPPENCFLQRKLVNSDPSRIEAVRRILDSHPKAIIFYNYNFELELLTKFLDDTRYPYSQWNGSKHEPILTGKKWVYLVNYMSGCEGWNCVTTDTIIFYSPSYSYRTMQQAAGRIDRLNTPYDELFYFELYSNAPIDLAIRQCLFRKKDFNEKAFMEG